MDSIIEREVRARWMHEMNGAIPIRAIAIMRPALFLFVLGISSQLNAQISVQDWNLVSVVQDFTQENPQDVARFVTFLNPFQASHSAQLGPGEATTSYDFSWTDHRASFRVDMDHVTPDLHSSIYSSTSTGSVSITTTEPHMAHLTGSYAYYLPVGGMDISTGLQITGGPGPPFHTFLDVSHREDTFVSPAPLSGVFTSDQAALIPAGTYSINYLTRLNAFGNSGALATGNGFFNLTLEPVPEPATVAVIAIGLIAARDSARVRKNPHCP